MGLTYRKGAWQLLPPSMIWQIILADSEGRKGVDQLRKAGCDPGNSSLWVNIASFPSLWQRRYDDRHAVPHRDERAVLRGVCPECSKGKLRTVANLGAVGIEWRLHRCTLCKYEVPSLESIVVPYATKRGILTMRARLERLISLSEQMALNIRFWMNMLAVPVLQSGDGDNFTAFKNFLNVLTKVPEAARPLAPLMTAWAQTPRSERASMHEEIFMLRDLIRRGCGGRPHDAALVRILGAAFRAMGLKPRVDYKYLKVIIARRHKPVPFTASVVLPKQ